MEREEDEFNIGFDEKEEDVPRVAEKPLVGTS